MRHETDPGAILTEAPPPAGSMRDLLYAFFRRRKLFIFSAVVILAAGAFATLSVPVIYKARADILVKPGARELTSVDSTLLDSKSVIHDDSLMRSESAILESQPVAAAVVENLGVDYVLGTGDDKSTGARQGWLIGKLETAKEKAEGWIREILPASTAKSVSVNSDKQLARAVAAVQHGIEVERRDNFITLYYRFSSPEKSQTLLGEVIKEYRKRRAQVYAVKPEEFRKETESVHSELSSKEDDLQEYLSKLDISSLEDDRKILLEQLSGIETELQRAEVIVSASETQLSALEGLTKGQANSLISTQAMTLNPIVQAYSDRLVNLQLSAIELLSKYPKNSQPVREVQKQIETLKSLIVAEQDFTQSADNTAGPVTADATQSSALPNPLLLARVSLEAQRAKQAILSGQKEKIKNRLNDLSSHELALSRLKRDVGVLEKSYLEYCTNLRQAEIQAALNNENISNVSLVQEPTLPGEPNRTVQTLVLAFTLIGALFGSITVVLIASHMDHTLHTPQDLEARLQIKTLAAIPLTRRADADGRISAMSAKPVSYFSGLGKADPMPTPEHAYMLGKEAS